MTGSEEEEGTPPTLASNPALLAVTLPSAGHKGRKEEKQASRENGPRAGSSQWGFFFYFLNYSRYLSTTDQASGHECATTRTWKKLFCLFFSLLRSARLASMERECDIAGKSLTGVIVLETN